MQQKEIHLYLIPSYRPTLTALLLRHDIFETPSCLIGGRQPLIEGLHSFYAQWESAEDS